MPSGVSVWNASGTPYIDHATIVDAVESLLGMVPCSAYSPRDDYQGQQAINLDALMVSDVIGDTDTFDKDFIGPSREELLDQNGVPIMPFGPQGEERGDAIIFSIRQIVDPEDMDGYYASGSELFVLDSLTGAAWFLVHGGHVWDHLYTLSDLVFLGAVEGQNDFHALIDINAIEAIGEELIEAAWLAGASSSLRVQTTPAKSTRLLRRPRWPLRAVAIIVAVSAVST